MSTLFTARELIELALTKIGAYTPSDWGPDPDEVETGMRWLDLNLAQLSGTHRIFFHVPATVSVPLTAGVQDYLLLDVLSPNTPEDGIQFPLDAWLEDAGGNRTELRIVTRQTFESVSDIDRSGTPERIWIDRLTEPTMRTWPVLGTGNTGYTVKLTLQTFAPSFATDDEGRATGLRAAWQRWATLQIAADLGDGPVRRLPLSEIQPWKNEAVQIKRQLAAFENREQQDYAPIAFYDGVD